MAIQQPIYRFEPSICVFVGELGDCVFRDFQPFKDLLPSWLRDGIGLIKLGVDPLSAQGIDFDGKIDGRIGEGDLPTIAQNGVNTVTAVANILSREDHGYNSRGVQPTIYIIGSHDDLLVGETLKVMDGLEHDGRLLPIVYLIETGEIQPVLWNAEATAGVATSHAPDVAIFFQNQTSLLRANQQPQLAGYADAPLRSYSISEALFTLCAAGMTEESAFQQLFAAGENRRTMAKIGEVTQLPAFALGAAGASMLVFPRHAFLKYDTYRKIASIFNERNLPDPAPSYDGDDLEDDAQELKTFVTKTIEGTNKAYRIVPSPRQRKKKVEYLRPKFKPLFDIDYTGKPYEEAFARLKDERERRDGYERDLFGALEYSEVSRKTQRQITFALASAQANSDARQSLRLWESRRQILWDNVTTLLRLHVVANLEQSWQDGSPGVRKAERVAQLLLHGFEQVNTDLGEEREADKARYDREVAYFETIVRHIPSNRPPILGDPQDGNPPPVRQETQLVVPVNLNKNIEQNDEAADAQGSGLPQREMDIARRFSFAIDLAYGQIPPTQMLAAVGLLAFVPLWVALTTLIPPIGPFAARWPQFTASALAAALLLGAAEYYIARRLRWNRMKRQLLEFYRLYYARRLEEWDHIRRAATITTLRQRIRRAHDRLADFAAFRNELRQEAGSRKKAVNHQLFHSPPAARDIFFANGNRLSEDAAYTLEHFAREIDHEIDAEIALGDDYWLNNEDEVFKRFLDYVHKRNEYLVDAEFDTIFLLVWEWLSPQFERRIRPQHEDVHYLLRADLQRGKPEVLPGLDDRATVLANNPQQPQVWQYVFATADDHDQVEQWVGWSADDHWTPTQSRNWFAKLRFVTVGGNFALPPESIAKLFPSF